MLFFILKVCFYSMYKMEMIKQLITKQFGNDVSVESVGKNLKIKCRNGAHAQVNPDLGWVKIKKHIQNKLNSAVTGTKCNGCFETIQATAVNCVKCLKYTCGECYINRFQDGMGIIECPCCNDKIGYKQTHLEVLMGVHEIKMKLGILN